MFEMGFDPPTENRKVYPGCMLLWWIKCFELCATTTYRVKGVVLGHSFIFGLYYNCKDDLEGAQTSLSLTRVTRMADVDRHISYVFMGTVWLKGSGTTGYLERIFTL